MKQEQYFIIVNADEPDLCWSIQSGWTSDDYDTFSLEERESVRLPAGCVWEQVPWKKEREQ